MVEVGVIVYTTFCALELLLMMVLAMVAELVAVKDSPVVLGLSVASHEKEEATFDVRLMLNGMPEHNVVVLLLVTLTVGTKLTVTLIGLPGHDPVEEVGVTE